MPKKNKVKFNICNVHYALLTLGTDGAVSFGTPVAMPGAVSLSLDPNGEPSNFYADGYAYYTVSNNMGYEGDLELAMVPESFRTDVLKEALDENKVLLENANAETENFALLFEFDGDVRKIRHVLYNCSAARPTIESQTNEDEIEVQTETLSITAAPLASGYVKAKTGDSTTDEVYQNWYKSVYLPDAALGGTSGGGTENGGTTDTEGEGISMSMKQNIEIDGKQVPFRASAAIPRIYRMKFHRDIYKDLRSLEKSIGDGDEESSNLDLFSLEMFENIAYVMAKHADPSIPDSPEEWLDEFNTFSIYQVLPKLIQLWGLNVQTDVQSKKNFARLTGK